VKKRTTISLPDKLKKALDKIKENDQAGRTLTQIITDILLRDDEVKEILKNI